MADLNYDPDDDGQAIRDQRVEEEMDRKAHMRKQAEEPPQKLLQETPTYYIMFQGFSLGEITTYSNLVKMALQHFGYVLTPKDD